MRRGNKMNKKIDIYVDDIDTFKERLNPNRLSNEIATYIEKEFFYLSGDQMTLEIHSKKAFREEEKENIVNLIREHYGLYVKRELKLQQVRRIKKFVLLVIGILLIAFSSYLASFFDSIIEELLLIAGWVVVWEFVYELIFTDNIARIKIIKSKQLTTCKIKFHTQ